MASAASHCSMEIAQFRTLVHVAEVGSVTAASQRLGIAQPALSRQIRLLEAELGGKLFERHGHGMTLTELGARVLTPVSEILARIKDVREIANERAGGLHGRVRVGITPVIGEIVTRPLVRAIRERHPQLSLCFTSGFSGHLVDWLKRDELDCCIAYAAAADTLIQTVPVLDETLLLISPPARGLSAGQPVPFARLASEALVLPSAAHGSRGVLDVIAARAGITLSPSLEVDSVTSMIDLVRDGLGTTVMPFAAVRHHVMSGELVAVPLVDPVPHCTVSVVYPTDRPVPPAAHFVGRMFAAVAADLVARGAWAGTTNAREASPA